MWITDRTQSDVDRVKEIAAKARTDTWTEAEQAEWVAGMKGALSYTDFNRIESGVLELANILGASVNVKTDWSVSGYLTTSDASRWLANIEAIRSKNSGSSQLGQIPTTASMDKLTFDIMNQIESILEDIETLSKTYVTFSGEYMTGEGQYGF
jgi:hypothetical protein|nr:MAG TPA: hypothetical protein [Caudoviricetes sp.]